MASRILIVEDDVLVQNLYADHLRSGGHLVEVAGSGEAGIDILRSKRFDVLVADMILPGMDGLDLLAETRTFDPDIGVIIISSLDMVDPAVRAIKAGAFDYLVKPVDPETLGISVQRCIEYRGLLWENIDLKRHLALSQAGARIAAATELSRVYHLAAEAVAMHMDAMLALVVSDPVGQPMVRSAVGSGPPLDPALISRLDEWLLASESTIELSSKAPPALRQLGSPLCLQVPGPNQALCLLAFPGGKRHFDDAAQRAGHFLVQHIGQALQALDKLEAAQHLAFIDDLTQLFNGRYLHRVLDRFMDKKGSSAQAFALLFMDLDGFKEVNDRHGHLVGSELLVEVAGVLKSCVRDGDIAVRYGGDEYVLVLPKADQETALKVAERIRGRLEQHVFLTSTAGGIRLTASVGVACYPQHSSDKRQLLDLADHAMYRGKKDTKNSVYLAASKVEA